MDMKITSSHPKEKPFAFRPPHARSHSIHVARVEVVTVGRPKGKYTQHANFCGSRLSGGCSSWLGEAGRSRGEAGACCLGKSISYKNSSKFYANLLLKQKLLPICLADCAAKLQMYAK